MTEVLVGTKKGLFALEGAPGAGFEVTARAFAGEPVEYAVRDPPCADGWFLAERGAIRRHINVFGNGELGGEETEVGADDRLDVLPAISGG